MEHIPFKLLSEYADGRISGQKKGDIESHLAACDSCRKALLAINNSTIALKAVEKERLSNSFDSAFHAKLNKRLESSNEYRLSSVMARAFDRLKELATSPSPALARVAIFVVSAVFLYGLLNYYPVEKAVIVSVKGKVVVHQAKDGKESPATAGRAISAGDTIIAFERSAADISQSGKYTIRIKGDSRISFVKAMPRYDRGSVAYNVEKGKVFVSITKKFKGSKFYIKTPEARATALGTMFLVDVSQQPSTLSKFSVLEGAVRVNTPFNEVTVWGGKAAEVPKGKASKAPRELLDQEWAELAEFYQIGHKAQVALLISDGTNRVQELLRPCPLYISDVEPRTVGRSLEDIIRLIDEAVKTKDTAKHLDGINRLEQILSKNPNASYEPQLFLFIGSYYNYLNRYEDAIRSFRNVVKKYPRSTFASMALYAIGIVYEEGLKNILEANHYYDLVLQQYPKSPEARSIKMLRKK